MAQKLNRPDGSIENRISSLRASCKECRACPLWEHATQAVFGEGNPNANIMLVGEQPGDMEDLQGHPFVGPSGQLLNKCLNEAGIDRGDVYITNAVKHFKWEQVGARRLHKKPYRREVLACHPWLQAEIEAIEPEAILCLGSTAAESVLGRFVKVKETRGQQLASGLAQAVMVSVHPSSLLRIPDPERRHEEQHRFIEDLKSLKRAIRA